MTFSDANEKGSKPHPMLGAQLGQYKILDVLGGGGMGVVFRARQLTVDRDVALKLLPPTLAHDEINTKRLEREAKALAKLSHPNIVTTFDFGLTEYAQAFLVMELVDGHSLKEVLASETRLDVQRALKIFIQLADAMRFAHGTGIIHRDLKPHNVMLAQKPSPDFVKVLDFGIARLSDSQKLTRVGEIIGSPLYMSPEQCLDDPVDGRTDIYSFGVLMYLCLTGTVPFKGNTLYETVEAKCTKPIPRFKEVAPDCEIPNFLEELVRHCLAVEPDERFQSMAELKSMLESMQVGHRKNDTLESTAILGTSPMMQGSTAPSSETIRAKMHAAKKKYGSVPLSQPGVSSELVERRTDEQAHKHVRSRHMESHRGIVLTPGVMIVGFVVIMVVLFAGVVVGISVVGQGTFLPNVGAKKADTTGGVSIGGDADNPASKTSTRQMSTPQVSTPQVSTPQVSTPQVSTPQVNKSQVKTPQAAVSSDSRSVPLPSTHAPVSQTKPAASRPASPAAVSTRLKRLRENAQQRVKNAARKRHGEDNAGLPRVRHTVPSDRGAQIWYDFERRE
ncbi:protein kinase [Candidatus Obscuribacterales bacterium]|nr:protein kinase [Candidatus Obscuribacterales bacterium]